MFSLINVLLVFIYNSPALTEDSNQESLLLESDSLTTVSCAFHIYHNYFSTAFLKPIKTYLAFVKNCGKILLHITATLLQITEKKPIKHYDKNHYKSQHSIWQTTTESYNKLRQKSITNYIKNLLQITAAQISPNYW